MVNLHIYVSTFDFMGVAAVICPNSTGRRARQRISGLRTYANREALKYWHDNFLPRHFTHANVQYKLQQRKVPYQNIKRHLAQHGYAVVGGRVVTIGTSEEPYPIQRGGTVNVVRSAHTEHRARAAKAISSYPSRAVIYLTVPRYAAIKPDDPTKPFLAKEIVATTAIERAMMARIWEREMLELMFAYNETIRLKIGGP